MNNAVFWDVMPCGSGNNPRFGGTYHLHLQGEENHLVRNSNSSNNQLDHAAKELSSSQCALIESYC
jgi:hypothetical protein